MKKPFYSKITCKCGALLAAMAVCLPSANAQIDLTNQLISYWPLGTVNNNQSTPDVQGGLDLVPEAGSSIVTFSGGGITVNSSGGTRGTNGYLTTGGGSLLRYQSPDNAFGLPSTPLPPSQFPNWTVSLWVKGTAPSGGGDRIVAFGDSITTTPILDVESGGSGSSGTITNLDNFVRQSPGTVNGKGNSETTNSQGVIFANYSGGTHQVIPANPWDNTWHNITLTAQTITNEPNPVIQGPFTAPANSNLTFTFTSTALDTLVGTNSASPFLTTNSSGALIGNEQIQPNTNQQYSLQVATQLTGPWTTVATGPTAGAGYTSLSDTNATNAIAFYRIVQPGVQLQNWSFYLDGNFVSSSVQFYSGANNTNSSGATPGDVQTPVGIPVPEVGNNVFASYIQNTGNVAGGSDPRAIQPPWGIWECDTFAVGGLLRTSAGSYLPSGIGIDEVAVWARAISSAEIKNYMAGGATFFL
jgi:hypothetical protein